MSSGLILFRSSHFVAPNQLVMQLPAPMVLKPGTMCGIYMTSQYNSFPNISSALGNNVVSLQVPHFTGANTYSMVTYSYTFADGYYSFSDINSALQQFCISQKLALYNSSTSTYWYPFFLCANTVLYKVQIQMGYYPSAALATAAGFALMSGAPIALNPATSNVTLVSAQFTFNDFFGKVIGFGSTTPTSGVSNSLPTAPMTKVATAWAKDIAQTSLSTKAPMINAIDSISYRCNIASNQCSIPDDLLAVLPISSSYGAINQYVANSIMWVPCAVTTTNRIVITLGDQNLSALTQQDSEVNLVLAIRGSD